ncbi:hypothetical protein [Baaleninema sp.]|uniref:hypothetical protein n=1 Tax=Baaleninema sp. TaxID=3101197 RepID=UPI003D03DB37
MSATPLQGIDLVNCAQANAKEGETVASQQCGYGDNLSQFRENLKRACEELGIEIERLSDLIDTDKLQQRTGESIAPDSMSDL